MRVTSAHSFAQEKSQKRLPEEEGGDTQATYAYFAAEAGAKARGKEPIGQVLLCCSFVFLSSMCPGLSATGQESTHFSIG